VAGAKEKIAAAKADWEAQIAQLDFAHADAKRAENCSRKKLSRSRIAILAVFQSQRAGENRRVGQSHYDLLLAGTRPEQIVQVRAQTHRVGHAVARDEKFSRRRIAF